ncbi:unnamed protein product [Sphagnum balticum]
MEYLAAYALSALSGKEPTADSVTAIVSATGKPADAAQVHAVVAALKGKKVEDVIRTGLAKVHVGAPAGGAPVKEEKKKEEKKKEEPKKEEKKAPEPAPPADDEDFGIDLFG